MWIWSPEHNSIRQGCKKLWQFVENVLNFNWEFIFDNKGNIMDKMELIMPDIELKVARIGKQMRIRT